MRFVVHALVKYADDFYTTVFLAVENHVLSKGACATTKKQIIPGTAQETIGGYVHFMQRLLDQMIIALEMDGSPIFKRIT